MLVLLLVLGVARPITQQEVCSTRWGLDRRHVTTAMKRQVAKRDGVSWTDRALYEFDHVIPRELGGADVVDNLKMQLWVDAHKKDLRENALHRAVCVGSMTLNAAQAEMVAWYAQP